MRSLSAPRSDFYEPPPSSNPILTDSFELRPAFIAMVQDQSFSGRERENPYHHLREFELLCSCLTIPGVSQGTIKWKLFPFSLVERAKHWYLHNISRMNGNWDRLRDNFCLAFFPQTRVSALRSEIFAFKQLEKESLGAAWTRFSLLTSAGPNLSIANHVLLEQFCYGLNNETAHLLDIIAGGSFAYKTPEEGKEILDRLVQNVLPDNDKVFVQLDDNASIQTQPTSPKSPHANENIDQDDDSFRIEDVFQFEDELFEDYGNTSNYFFEKKPQKVVITDPWELIYLAELTTQISAILSEGWLEEVENSTDIVQINSPPSTLSCLIRRTPICIPYNPTVGMNIMSLSVN